MKSSDCCWATYDEWGSGEIWCNSCGERCKIVTVTQKMINHVENAREEAIKWGYLEGE